MTILNAVQRVASFGGRKPKKAALTENFSANSQKPTPRLQKPTTPRSVTPRTIEPQATQVLAIELARESKTEPLGLKFEVLADYFSGVIITEVAVASKAEQAGLKPGDCVHHIGSRACETAHEVMAALQAIAGEVAIGVTRAKKLPPGWQIKRKSGAAMLTRKASETKEPSRPQCELVIETVPGASTGIALKANKQGEVVIHQLRPDSVFARHAKVGDRLTKVNGVDIAGNPLGAARALTEASGTLHVLGTFVAPSVACAAIGCECCRHLLVVPGLSLCSAQAVGNKFGFESALDASARSMLKVEDAKATKKTPCAGETEGAASQAPTEATPIEEATATEATAEEANVDHSTVEVQVEDCERESVWVGESERESIGEASLVV